MPLLDTKAEAERKEKFKKRENEDIDALDEIVMAINNDVLNRIIGVTYAKEAMDILVKTYQRVGTGAVIAMRGRLQSLKDKRYESMGELFDHYDIIIRELERMGAEMTNAEKIHSLLLAVPPVFNHVTGALTRSSAKSRW